MRKNSTARRSRATTNTNIIPFPVRLSSVLPSTDEPVLTDERISLDVKLITNRAATYFLNVCGENDEFGFSPGDMLIVDRAVPAKLGEACVYMLDRELYIGRLRADDKFFGSIMYHIRAMSPSLKSKGGAR